MAGVQIAKNQKGAIAILTLLVIMSVALAITGSIAVLSIDELKMSRTGGALDQTFYAAETGLNEALYRLAANPAANINLQVADVSVNVTVSPDPTDPYRRIVQSRAVAADGTVRTVRLTANTNSFAAGFDYAVQGGAGGVYLDNNSVVVGDVYSNGSILPASGGAKGNIQGSAWAANSSLVDRATVSGDVHSENITRCDISGDAYYMNIDGSTTVGGNSYTPVPGPGPKPFPVNEADVNNWKTDIAGTGNPELDADPAGCPPSKNSGFYCVTGNQTLGFQKINGDFYVGNGATLTLTGNLWVTGNIIMDNNGSITVDPSLGSDSAVMIADGQVDVNNNYTISGSGDPHSFVLIISMDPSNDPSSPALYAANNSASILFAALKGMLKVKNNGQLNAAAAETLYLEPNSQVIYNPNLSIFSVPNGGGNSVGTALNSWREL